MQGKKILITKEQILSAIQDLATHLGRAPTREELEQMGGITVGAVRKNFTRHRSAVRAAGLEPAPTGATERSVCEPSRAGQRKPTTAGDWEHNWVGCPREMMVLELEKIMGKYKKL